MLPLQYLVLQGVWASPGLLCATRMSRGEVKFDTPTNYLYLTQNENKMKRSRLNKNWNQEISDEEVFNREFSIGYLIQNNLDLPLFQNLKDRVLSTYEVVAEFEYLGFNGSSIFANGQRLVYRKNKFSKISLGEDVKLLESGLKTEGGGSNKYPSVAYEGAKCTIQFISYGLPFVDKINGWSVKIISIDKLTT